MNVTSEGVDDELDVFGGYSLESFLDHMVPVLIFNAFKNVVLKFSNELRLLVGQDVFQSLRNVSEKQKFKKFDGTNLLHYAATVHLAG